MKRKMENRDRTRLGRGGGGGREKRGGGVRFLLDPERQECQKGAQRGIAGVLKIKGQVCVVKEGELTQLEKKTRKTCSPQKKV